jgi:cholesterol transport system auxiliary component
VKRYATTVLCLAVTALALLCAGCAGSLTGPAPEIHHYALRPAPPAPAGVSATGVLKVRRLAIAPESSGREMVYRTGETLYAFDYYNQYLVNPADMLTQATRRAMRSAALFTAVAGDGSTLRPDYVLEGTVSALHGDFQDTDAPAAVVQMQFFLLRDTVGDYDIMFDQTYTQRVPLRRHKAADLASALERGVQDILHQLAADLAATLSAQP